MKKKQNTTKKQIRPEGMEEIAILGIGYDVPASIIAEKYGVTERTVFRWFKKINDMKGFKVKRGKKVYKY